MRVITGQVKSNQVINGSAEIIGQVNGDVRVIDGGKLSLRGQINGNVLIEEGGEMFLHGQVNGDVLNVGGYLQIFGNIDGRLFREKGKTIVQPDVFV